MIFQVVREISREGGRTFRYLLTPNRSLTDSQALLVCTALSFPVLVIGVACFALGLPLVLPYSGLEVICLASAMYMVQRWARRSQCVEILDDRVIVQFRDPCRKNGDRMIEFQRAWAKVVLERDTKEWYPSKLKLRSHGREIEIGEFLVEDERQELSKRLVQTIPPSYDSATA